MSTKEKILEAALKLFNRDGMVNVRLQHIADEAFISVGNLAYHYKNKEAILTALYQELRQKQQELLTEYRIVPLFDNLDRLFRLTFQLQQAYEFFYLDTLEILRAYPSIGTAHQEYISSQIRQIKTIIDFNVSRGVLIPEPMENIYENVSLQIWMTMDHWLMQEVSRTGNKAQENEYRLAVWALLVPYFTDMGKLEYKQMLDRPYDFFF